MATYIIETRKDGDYIVAIDHDFTLKVIPPDQQNEDEAYPPYQAVTAIWEDNRPDPVREEFESEESYTQELLSRANGHGDGAQYDFLSDDTGFRDDDTKDPNKELWLEAINFYSQTKLGLTAVDLEPHSYNYDAQY